MTKVCFIVVSVIQTKPGNLLTAPRSIYTHAERFDQTLGTLRSIKQFVPDSDIFFIEGSDLTPERESIIKSMVKGYINTSKSDVVTYQVDSILKGYGECVMSGIALRTFPCNKYDLVIKFNARYELTPEFNIEDFSRLDRPTFCRAGYNKKEESVSTVLYSIPVGSITHVISALGKVQDFFHSYDSAGNFQVDTLPWYEVEVPKNIQDYNLISKCGVLCRVSPNGHTFVC